MLPMQDSADVNATLARLPRFLEIDPTKLVEQLKSLLETQGEQIRGLSSNCDEARFETVVEPMEAMADELHRFFSPISHLHNVADSEALREPYKACVGLISEFSSDLDQNEQLYRCYERIAAAKDFAEFPAARRKLVENALRDFRLGGVALMPTLQAEVKRLRAELAQLGTRFEENLLDAGEAFKLNVADDKRLAGLPASTLTLARQNAERDNSSGWTLTLDLPCYVPAMMQLHDRELRHSLYRAYVTRASDQGPHAGQFDNSEVMAAIVGHRQELAHALGFANFAELSLATKMAPSTAAVIDFLHELAERAGPAAHRELDELARWAETELGVAPIEAWDLAYCSERYREQRFNFSQEDLRPYFPVPGVLSGLFKVANALFDIHVQAFAEHVETWHEDVGVFSLTDSAGATCGFFFLDLYARQGKRSGAWMDECLVRWRHQTGLQLPVAYLTCNFTPPLKPQPTLLTHDEVITLFHEFGHGLHHLLTQVENRSVAGINGVPWDAVELPSQILENWCWERDALDLIGAHHVDGSPIPEDLYQRVRAAKRYQGALQTLRQVELALFDFRLHMDYTTGFNIQGLLNEVREQVAVLKPPTWNRFQHSFGHIFAGGYAAGYYSYKWAEVLAADAFARFEEDGIFNRQTGLDFRHAILEMGGAEDAMTLFKRFRGREPKVEPLLRQAGLIA